MNGFLSREVAQYVLQLHHIHKHLTGLSTGGGTDDAGSLELVHDLSRAGESHLETALHGACGSESALHYGLGHLLEKHVAV